MADLQWDGVKEWFDPSTNGTLPDVIVQDTTLTDWETLLRLIRSESWRSEYEFRDQVHPMPASAAELFVPDPEGWLRTLRIWPDPDMEWIVRPSLPEEIDSDVSLHEIQGQERLNVFCQFLRKLGIALSKRILVYAEGAYDGYPPMMAYEVAADRVVFLRA
ncbi:hypothetical protein GCM10023322_52430 [Rugosimonospora acidiphila]|uniref:Uncharacterized protein n=1 Tax=Rugosimonospora acidiphila TaxID=556531 RepID=A0ABP9S8L7_9ACTN